jgi:hypothetical protein
LKNDKILKYKSENISPLKFLVSQSLKKYFDYNNILVKNTNSGSYSFEPNELIGSISYNICELTDMSKCKIYFKIDSSCDIIKHIDLEFKNLKSNKSDKLARIKKIDKNIYNLDDWIENNGKKIYDFGTNIMNNKIRLSCKNKFISMIGLNQYVTFLVVEIPLDKFDDWKNIFMSIGKIYSDSLVRRNMVSYALTTVSVIEQI